MFSFEIILFFFSGGEMTRFNFLCDRALLWLWQKITLERKPLSGDIYKMEG